MANASDNENALNATLSPRENASPTISDSLSSSKEDSLLGLNKKQVILENSLLTGRNTNCSPLENSEVRNASSSSQDFIVNERSNMPQNNHSAKMRQDDSPDSCSVVLDDEESLGSGIESDVEDASSEEKPGEPSKVLSLLPHYDPTIDTKLPETVSLLTTPDGGKVYLVGTAHFSMESQEDVAKIIQAVQPHIVLVELCKSRVNILQLDEKTVLEEAKNINFEKVQSTIKQNGVFNGLMYILLLSMSAHLTKQLGMAPGGEFRRAFAEARQVPMCLIHLGDRPIHITLQRALASLSWWQTIRLMWHLIMSKQPISKEEVERCKRRDLLEEMLAEMAGEFPALGTVFVNERDVFLTHSLQLAALPQRTNSGVVPVRVVGVVGIGHVPGIVQHWGKVTAGDIPPIMKVPPPTLTSRVLKLTVKASLFGLVVWGVSRIVPLPKSLPNSIDTIRTSVHDFFHIGGAGQGRF
ncbi:traB domain-containing protein isoform X2 [Cryptotermes secundus]|uniref:traB domain-containing protein isoform X2 n=1 Tax=Cryptotermes secundus TaxID=105785 RepID=UPI000CD7CAE0|nr:traB domain-containing protein isoform X2 [Cryptotermes secundus]